MKFRLPLLFLVVFSPVMAAESLDFVIGNDNTRIEIEIPDRYCLLDINNPSDRRVLDRFDQQAKGRHRRLVFMVDCEQLEAWRNGDLPAFDDFGFVLLPEEHIDQTTEETLNEYLNGLIDEIDHGRTDVIRHRGNGYLEKRIEERVVELEQVTSVDLGLIYRDNVALYTASLDRIQTEAGEQALSGKVTAITLLNGKPLFFYRVRKLENLGTIGTIESALSEWVARTHQANR